MHRHPHFDLWLHDDDELARLVRGGIVERRTLHEWPLSCVQRLVTSDGRQVIYKTQFGPTVEPAFYASARSALLASAQIIYQAGDGHVGMLIEFITDPSLQDLDPTEEQVARIGRALINEIGQIGGELPCFADVSTEAKWEGLVNVALGDLDELIGVGQFNRVNRPMVSRLRERAFSRPVRSALRARPGYVHHDLRGDNIFVLPGGYRVIDWQRPLRGPTDLDLATLLESAGCDPSKHVEKGVVWVMYMLRIHWLAQCARRWFSAGAAGYDRDIARLAALMGE